jgi:flavin-dependent dehydrogenase
MKIAVVGAGIAGITCAEELHKLGHEVEVFEMSAKGQPTRPRQMEGVAYFLGTVPEIETNRKMRRLKIHSTNVTASLEGKLGFFYEVGGKDGADEKARKGVENLLPVHYSTRVASRSQLQDKFQVIVAADGYRSAIAKEAEVLVSKTPRRVGLGIGFTVEGDFDDEGMEIWFDERFALSGYTYAIPFSNHEASLVSASVARTISAATYRQKLKDLAEFNGWQMRESWVDFECWYDFQTYAKNNLYVVGAAGSFSEPAFGFGLKWAVKSAKLCARAIHENADYNRLVQKEVTQDFVPFQTMRRFFENAQNKDYDRFVESFKNPLVRVLAGSGKALQRMYARKRMFKV